MKNWMKAIVVASGIALAAPFALANDYEAVKSKIQQTLRLDVSAIGDAPVPGLVQVITDRGLFYTTSDGKYLIHGRIFNLDADMRNETEVALSGERLKGVETFSDSVIEFKAENEKYVVNVFTDITCGYCRKLHNEMEEYNDLGITVRYLAFPRAGVRSEAFNDMVSVWCSDDQQAAMTAAKNGKSIDDASCANKVEQQLNFGRKIGVGGTPNIILPDGSLIAGYQPADQLLASLKNI